MEAKKDKETINELRIEIESVRAQLDESQTQMSKLREANNEYQNECNYFFKRIFYAF